MRFASTTFADLQQRGTFPRVRQQLSPDNGCRVLASTFSKQCTRNWVTSRSSSRIWELSLQMFRHCVTNFNFRGLEFCNSPLTVTQTIHICRTTLFPTQSPIPARTTTRQLGNGTKNYPTTSDKTCGITRSARREGVTKLLRRSCNWHGHRKRR